MAVAITYSWINWNTEGQKNPFAPDDTARQEPGSSMEGQTDVLRAEASKRTGYVGSQRCTACHSEIADAWQTHPMSRSITLAEELPDSAHAVDPVVPGTTRRYVVDEEQGRMLHREEMLNADGSKIFSQAVTMDYVVGSGQRAHAYLHQKGELIFQSPINWYSRDNKWDLAPGYRPDDPRRFRRRVTDDCLSCHAGWVRPTGATHHRFQDPPFGEMAIGCENCHGPGQAHISFQLTQEQPETTAETDPILNPAHLPARERESVCNQCHLQPSARITRFGRREMDFRPGMSYRDVWTAVELEDSQDAHGESRAVSHVQQMRSSRCFANSGEALGCISCHDPHRVPQAEERVNFYRNRCLKCHESDHCGADTKQRATRMDSCVDCHMPKGDPNNISHVSQTDHRILKHPTKQSPDDALAAEQPVRLKLLDGETTETSTWEAKRALAVGTWSYFNKKGYRVPDSLGAQLESCLEQEPSDGLVLSTLGAFWMQQGDLQQAGLFFSRAQQYSVSRESALAGLLDISYAQGDWSTASHYVERCLELDPGHPGYHAVHADILLNQGKLQDAINAAETSIELDPTRIAVRSWLAQAYDRAGQSAAAERMRNIISQMNAVKEAIE